MSDQKKVTKRAYATPVLNVYGTVEEITESSGGNKGDAAQMPPRIPRQGGKTK